MPKKFRVLTSSNLCKEAVAGSFVYEQTAHDYGLSRDDTRLTGVEHITVTLRSDGQHPGFTMPKRDLEEVPNVPT